MNIKDKLEQETINRLSEASYIRIYKQTQDESTFAIMGSEEEDSGKNKKRRLYDLLKNDQDKSGLRLGFNQAKGVYTYQDNNQEKKVAQEDSLIIYDIDKQGALDIANAINQESIVWKDPSFFGILYTNGSVMAEFDNQAGNNMDFSGAEQSGFGTKLNNDKVSNLGFKFEGSIIYPNGYTNKEPEIEDFIFYSK